MTVAMGLARSVLCAAIAFTATATLGQDFTAYEGKNTVREGEGGGKKVVEGVDFWSDGEPPRKYKLVGYITDRRLKSGLFGMASMAGLEKDVALLAKKNGGDAVIQMGSETETTGSVGTAFGSRFGNSASGFGAAAAVQKNNSKFAVLKYVNDVDLPPPAVPAAAGVQTSSVAPAETPSGATPIIESK
jgi:hypothetical protein